MAGCVRMSVSAWGTVALSMILQHAKVADRQLSAEDQLLAHIHTIKGR